MISNDIFGYGMYVCIGARYICMYESVCTVGMYEFVVRCIVLRVGYALYV